MQISLFDARNPLVLDARELERRPGTSSPLEAALPAPAELGIDVATIAEKTPIVLSGRLEAVMEGVLLTGTATTSGTGECIRCLDTFPLEIVVPIQELFTYADKAAREVATGDEEPEAVLVDGQADLEPLLRDSLVTALPMQPLCRQDCPGLCDQCGIRFDEHPDHKHDVIDPRWSALAALVEPELSAENVAHTQEKEN